MAKKPKAHSERAHSPLSPSGLERGMACPASVLLEDKMPRVTSVYAEEGTEAHELAESILTGKVYPKHTPEMLTAVSVYTEFVLDETEEDDEFVVEYRLDLSHLAPDMFGTLDFGRWRPRTKELLVVDLKYGAGKAVVANRNPQLMAYASGLARFFECEPDTVRVVVVQPRQDNPIRQWTFDGLELFDFEQDVIKAAEIAFGPEPPFSPGDHCRWCKAAASCPAMLTKAKSVALGEFELPEEGVSADDLADALKLARLVTAWAKSVEDLATEEATAGRIPTGFDWVPTRPTTKWKDEEEAKRFLGGVGVPEQMFMNEPTIRTPLQVKAAVSKILKDDEVEELAEYYGSVSGGHKLVPLKPGAAKQSEAVALEELSGEVDFLS